MTPVVINLNIKRKVMQTTLCSVETGDYEVFVKPFQLKKTDSSILCLVLPDR